MNLPIKPFSPEELDREERRNTAALQRCEEFFGPGGLCEQHERRGDELLEFAVIVEWLSSEPTIRLSAAGAIKRFITSVRLGGFPVPRTGFVEEPQRRAVRDLFDLQSFNKFALQPGESYPLQPSILTVEATPLAMRAKRSIWAQWIAAQGWLVPPELQSAAAPEPAPMLPEAQSAPAHKPAPIPPASEPAPMPSASEPAPMPPAEVLGVADSRALLQERLNTWIRNTVRDGRAPMHDDSHWLTRAKAAVPGATSRMLRVAIRNLPQARRRGRAPAPN